MAESIELTGTIDPATSAWVSQALEDAAQRGAPVAILRLDAASAGLFITLVS